MNRNDQFLEAILGNWEGVDTGHIGDRGLIGMKKPLKSRYKPLKALKVHVVFMHVGRKNGIALLFKNGLVYFHWFNLAGTPGTSRFIVLQASNMGDTSHI